MDTMRQSAYLVVNPITDDICEGLDGGGGVSGIHYSLKI